MGAGARLHGLRAAAALACLAGLAPACGARTALHAGSDAAEDATAIARDAGTDAPLADDAGSDAEPGSDAGSDAALARDAGSDAGDPCLGLGTFAGTWTGPGAQSATIVQTGDALAGTWITNPRPPFSGTIARVDGRCVVTMTFPDDATFVATLAADGCEIDWSNATVWRKSGCP